MEQDDASIEQFIHIDSKTIRVDTPSGSSSSSEGVVIGKDEYPLGLTNTLFTQRAPAANPRFRHELPIRSTPSPRPCAPAQSSVGNGTTNRTPEAAPAPFYTIEISQSSVPRTVPQTALDLVEVIVGPPEHSPVDPALTSSRPPGVGPRQRIFHVSASLLTQHSSIFAEKLLVQGKDKPIMIPYRAVSYRIRLPSTTPNTFQTFLGYMNSSIYSTGSREGEIVRDNTLCWALGKHLGCAPFRQAALRKLYDIFDPKCPERLALTGHAVTNYMEFMILNTDIGSAIRRLYIDALTSRHSNLAIELLAKQCLTRSFPNTAFNMGSDMSGRLQKYKDFILGLNATAKWADEYRSQILKPLKEYMGEEDMPSYPMVQTFSREKGIHLVPAALPEPERAASSVKRAPSSGDEPIRPKHKRQKSESPPGSSSGDSNHSIYTRPNLRNGDGTNPFMAGQYTLDEAGVPTVIEQHMEGTNGMSNGIDPSFSPQQLFDDRHATKNPKTLRVDASMPDRDSSQQENALNNTQRKEKGPLSGPAPETDFLFYSNDEPMDDVGFDPDEED